MWLNLRIAVTRILMSVLLPILEGLNDYARRLAREAKLELRLAPISGPTAPIAQPETQKMVTHCSICNFAWLENTGKRLSEIECPDCGSEFVMIGAEAR